MDVQSLGYVRIGAQDTRRWLGFGSEILGMQAVESDGAAYLRMDNRHHRLAIEASDTDGGLAYGWEVADPAALDAAATELEAAGVAVEEGTKEQLESRRVAGLLSCLDPAGHRVELFCGADQAESEFAPGRPLAGFKTGELGMGHVVLMVPDIEPAVRFYTDVLGFRVSDYMRTPLVATFLHTNRRHHSLALLEVGVTGLHHLMVELNDIDDVGRAYDLVRAEGIEVARSLGRHSNDRVISFYARTPSGFEIEYGYGGLLVDEGTWEPTELESASCWGHQPA